MEVITPLTQARCTLRLVSPANALLAHVVRSVSDFLDVSLTISLPAAAASRSVRLLDRVATRLLNNDVAVSPSVKQHLFAGALTAAIKNDDLLMVQKIHSLHVEPLVVPSLALAVEFGTLELVQWVVAHRSDQSCCAAGVENLCVFHVGRSLASVGPQDTLRVVQWLAEACDGSLLRLWSGECHGPLLRSTVRSVELLRWLVEENHLTSFVTENAIFCATQDPAVSVETMRFLVNVYLWRFGKRNSRVRVNQAPRISTTRTRKADIPRGMVDMFIRVLFSASLQRANEDKVEYLLSTPLAASFRRKVSYTARLEGAPKVLYWPREAMTDGGHYPELRTFHDDLLRGMASFCHVETVQWLYEERDFFHLKPVFDTSVKEQDVLELFQWMVRVEIEREKWPPQLFDRLAGRGFLQAAMFVQDLGVARRSSLAMDIAAGQGRLDAVIWLHEQQGYEGNTTSAMACAAEGGHVHVLEWLHANRVGGCLACVRQSLLVKPRSTVFIWPAYNPVPVLASLLWLDERQAALIPCDCSEGIEAGAFVSVPLSSLDANAGDMKLLEYLHEHDREQFAQSRAEPNAASDMFVRGGLCLNVAKWLYTHHRESVNWEMIIEFSGYDNLMQQNPRNQSVYTWLQHEIARAHTDDEEQQ